MDVRVKWSPEAVEDLESIVNYIERDSQNYARAVISKILEISRGLCEFPMSGRIVPELGDDKIRERFVFSYRLVYKIEDERILIVAVVHGKRLFDQLSERF